MDFGLKAEMATDTRHGHDNLGLLPGSDGFNGLGQLREEQGLEGSHRRYNLGVAYTALGNHQAAVDAYKEALRIKPNYLQARFNLALGYSALGRRDLALDQYRMLRDMDKTLSDRLLGLIGSNK